MTWDDIHRQKRWGTCPNEHMARFAKRHIPEGGRILDIGCGIGANANWLASEGYCVSAIDVSPTAIANFIDRSNEWMVDARVASATELPFDNGTFDAAIEVCVLQHLSETDAALALNESYRVLKPGGQIFSIMAIKGHSMKAFPDGIYTRLQSSDEIICFFEDNDFHIEGCGPSKYLDEKYGYIFHWITRARRR